MSDITLYGYATSPYVRKTASFLYYKGLDFDHVAVSPIDPAATIGFTGKTQVPVLKIGDEWKLESSEHGFWLDELYPERPICPAEGREKAVALNKWAEGFINAGFRPIIDGKVTAPMRYRLWRMAEVVHSFTPMPDEIRTKWPDFVFQAPFIKAMGDHMDLTESAKDMSTRLGMEFVGHLGDGPFLGGFETPTMADLSLFVNVGIMYMLGLEDEPAIFQAPPLKDWFLRVAEHLPANPVLVKDYMIINPIENLR